MIKSVQIPASSSTPIKLAEITSDVPVDVPVTVTITTAGDVMVGDASVDYTNGLRLSTMGVSVDLVMRGLNPQVWVKGRSGNVEAVTVNIRSRGGDR